MSDAAKLLADLARAKVLSQNEAQRAHDARRGAGMSIESFACPCDYAMRTGLDPRKLQQVGLADNVLYLPILIVTDSRGGEPFYLRPCRKCDPPPPGELPKPPQRAHDARRGA